MKLKKIAKILMIILLVIIWSIMPFMSNKVYARDNYAYSASSYTTKQYIANQTISDTRYYMGKAGYNTGGDIDPSRQRLWENLYADVQIFLSHGDWDRITFANTGILAGASQNWVGKDHIGTDDVHWDADTILVVYSSCYSSKDNNLNGLSGKTALKGADIVIGFRDEIPDLSALLWNETFMSELANGKGTREAMDKANSLTYPDNGIKCGTIWFYGESNIKIGKYRNNTNTLTNEYIVDTNNILNLNKSKKTITNKIEDISTYIKNYDTTFDENDYIITRTNGTNEVNLETGEVKVNEEIIDYQLKIGDYITNAGYCVKVKDGVVTAIYDNTLPIKKTNIDIKKDKEEFEVNLSKENINLFKTESIRRAKINNNEAIITGQDYKFYYDVNTNKKYIIVSTDVQTQEPDGGKTFGIEEQLYEI